MKTNHIAFYQFCSGVRRKGALALCLALCVLGLGLSASAQKHGPTIITFDAPGAGTGYAQGTQPNSINAAGAITGWYCDAITCHGFLRAPDGTITTFDPPGSVYTLALSINPAGAITGIFEYANSEEQGFVRDPDGSITTFNAGSVGSLALSINPAGAITGNCWDESPGRVSHGFVRDRHGKITRFDVPGPVGTVGWSINPAGEIAGFYDDANGAYHTFLRDPHGRITKIDAPGAGTDPGQGTCVGCWYGLGTSVLNPAGEIAGFVVDSDWVWHGFLRDRHGKITTFDAPGAGADPGSTEGSYPMSINPDGTVAGFVQGTDWLTHGFSRSPDGRFTTFDVPGAGTDVGTWEGTFPMSINPAGAITGYYLDENWVVHGFLRIPGEAEGHERMEHSEGHRR